MASSSSYPAHDVGDAPQWAANDIACVKSELTLSPDFRTLSELPSLPPQTPNHPQAAIFTSYTRTPSNTCQDVRSVVNSSASYLSSPVTRTDAFSHYLGPSVSSSSTTPSQHVLTTRRQRPRTSNKVFTAHGTIAPNGLPKSLPPAPSTAPRRTQPEPELSDFFALSNNYLNMLKSKGNAMDANNNTASVPTEAQSFRPEDVQNIFDVITGDILASDDEADGDSDFYSGSSSNSSMPPPPTPETPELWTSPAWSDAHDFGALSPDTDLLNTPLFGDDDMLTGMIEGDFEGALFPSMDQFPEFFEKAPQPAPSLPDNLFTLTPESPAIHDFSPTVNPTSLHPSPLLPVDHSFASPAPSAPIHAFPLSAQVSTSLPVSPDVGAPVIRRKSSATGTRKGVTPGALVPIDAPTQPRRYAIPSATSRKELPTTFARKRARSTAFGEEDDEFNEPPPGPDATEREQIEYKRRQNTVAARRSRKRKLEHQQFLEAEVERLTRERDEWKTKAMVYVNVLQSNGIPCAPFDDDSD